MAVKYEKDMLKYIIYILFLINIRNGYKTNKKKFCILVIEIGENNLCI